MAMHRRSFALLALTLAILTGCGAGGPAQRHLWLGAQGSGGQSSDSSSGQTSDGSSDGSSKGGGGGGGGMAMMDDADAKKSGTSESGPTTRDGESKSTSDSDDDVASASVVFLSLLSLATVVLIVYLGYVSTREVSADAPAVPAPAPAELERLNRKARDYLVANRRSLRASLARGDGPFVVELAGALDLPAPLRPRLGAVIQAHHAQLDPWLDGLTAEALDPQAALGFGRALAAALDADPALGPHLARHRAAFLAAAE